MLSVPVVSQITTITTMTITGIYFLNKFCDNLKPLRSHEKEPKVSAGPEDLSEFPAR